MTWEQGRAAIDDMIRRGRLERVPASRSHADQLIGQAGQHVAAARAVMAIDPTGAYQLLYDSARKAINAVLESQGLRATSRGGHVAVIDAITAQLDPPLGETFGPFDRLRRRRNQAEYPARDTPPVRSAEVERDLPKAQAIIDAAVTVLDQMTPF